MGDAPPQDSDSVGQIKKTVRMMVLRRLFSSLPVKQVGKQNLVIFVVFFVALGL